MRPDVEAQIGTFWCTDHMLMEFILPSHFCLITTHIDFFICWIMRDFGQSKAKVEIKNKRYNGDQALGMSRWSTLSWYGNKGHLSRWVLYIWTLVHVRMRLTENIAPSWRRLLQNFSIEQFIKRAPSPHIYALKKGLGGAFSKNGLEM